MHVHGWAIVSSWSKQYDITLPTLTKVKMAAVRIWSNVQT